MPSEYVSVSGNASTWSSSSRGSTISGEIIFARRYPVFRLMEGVLAFEDGEAKRDEKSQRNLKDTPEGMMAHLFQTTETRQADAYFPFADPSLELEVHLEDDWSEVLGSGMTQAHVPKNAGVEGRREWALGIGPERLAMTRFSVPNIRLFWVRDPRFCDEFEQGKVMRPGKFSECPTRYDDASFPGPDRFHESVSRARARDVAGDLAEGVACVGRFARPDTRQKSNCSRVGCRSAERSPE